jgi:hypothetical protein
MYDSPEEYDASVEHQCRQALGLFHFYIELSLHNASGALTELAEAFTETLPSHEHTPWMASHLRAVAENVECLKQTINCLFNLPPVVTPEEDDRLDWLMSNRTST